MRFLPLFFLLLLLPVESAGAGNLGTNLGGVNYYDGQVVFSDIIKQGGEWIDTEPLEEDAQGWPTKISGPVRMALAERQYPRGTYRVSWKGSGTFIVGGKAFSGKDGRGQVFLDGSSLVLLEITQVSRTNHLRNIRVRVPDEQGVFRSAYLRSLRPYRALRFMDWQRTNGTWADPVPRLSCRDALRRNYISQGRRKGVSVAWMIALANRLRASPWFTVPHRADASWLRCHARYVKRHLRQGLLPRYEFSNETWNPAFEQYHDLSSSGATDPFLELQLESARRHIQMVRTIKPIMRSRPWRSVLAGQAANSWVLEQRLSLASRWTDEIAIAPYMHLPGVNLFEPEDALVWSERTPEEVLVRLRESLQEEVRPWIRSHLDFGKPLLAYEGGQHLVGLPETADVLVRSNGLPQMGELYRDYLRLWQEETKDRLFMHFLDSGPWTEYGSWGAVQVPGETSWKYEALLWFKQKQR